MSPVVSFLPFHLFVHLVLIILLPFLPSHYLIHAVFFSVSYVQIAYIWSSLNLSTRYFFALRFRVHAYRSFTNTKVRYITIYIVSSFDLDFASLSSVPAYTRCSSFLFAFRQYITLVLVPLNEISGIFVYLETQPQNTCLSLTLLVMLSSTNSDGGQMGFFPLLFHL